MHKVIYGFGICSGPPGPYQPQGWGNGYPHWQQGQPDPNKAAADANAAAWAAFYAQHQQQPQAPMTPTNEAPDTTQTIGQGQQGQQLQDYTKAWEEYYKKQGQAAPQVATAGASQPGGHPDYSAAWAEYYRQQAAYYGKSGSRPMGAAPQAQQLQQASRQQSDKTLTKLFS
ncbi:hypothetical protein MHYP_G00002070 [Metynnis hypsauchen]